MLVFTYLLLQTSLSLAWTFAIFPSLVSLLAVKPPFYLFIMLLLDYLSNRAQFDSFSVKAFSIISGELLDLPCVPVYLVQVVIMTHIPQHFASYTYLHNHHTLLDCKSIEGRCCHLFVPKSYSSSLLNSASGIMKAW